MGLLRHRDDPPAGASRCTRSSIGDDAWIEDEALSLALTVAIDEIGRGS